MTFSIGYELECVWIYYSRCKFWLTSLSN